MITEKQIEIGKMLLETRLLNSFYHSVVLALDEKANAMFPVYRQGNEEKYIGPDDTKGRFAYIRQSGPVSKLEERFETSDQKLYKLAAPCRIVVFNDHEENDFEELIRKMLAPVFRSDVSLTSYSCDAFKLAQQESPIGDFAFDATTFYLAIDIRIIWLLNAKDCDDVQCITYPNPICS